MDIDGATPRGGGATVAVRAAGVDSPGGRDALDVIRLYDDFGGLAMGIAMRILGDPGAAEEVVQDAFLAAWRHSASFDQRRGSLRSWICTIVRHRAIDKVRGRVREDRSGASIDDLVLVGSPDVADEVVEAHDRDAVRHAVSALPSEQRQAIELAYFGGFSQSEIARMTSTPLGTIKGRTRAAMASLRRAWLSAEAEAANFLTDCVGCPETVRE